MHPTKLDAITYQYFQDRRILLAVILVLLSPSIFAQSPVQDEVWQRELQYWQYVQHNDIAGYMTLWHEDFLGYPGSDGVVRKNRIADWINAIHNKKDLSYEYKLEKKAVNAFGDVVVTFYDETDMWRNDKNEVVLQETFKITHTWKKYGDKWLIIGGMSATKQK